MATQLNAWFIELYLFKVILQTLYFSGYKTSTLEAQKVILIHLFSVSTSLLGQLVIFNSHLLLLAETDNNICTSTRSRLLTDTAGNNRPGEHTPTCLGAHLGMESGSGTVQFCGQQEQVDLRLTWCRTFSYAVWSAGLADHMIKNWSLYPFIWCLYKIIVKSRSIFFQVSTSEPLNNHHVQAVFD